MFPSGEAEADEPQNGQRRDKESRQDSVADELTVDHLDSVNVKQTMGDKCWATSRGNGQKGKWKEWPAATTGDQEEHPIWAAALPHEALVWQGTVES
jgi:hypothetical protein